MWDFLLNSLPMILTAIAGMAVVWIYLSKILGVLKEVSEGLLAFIEMVKLQPGETKPTVTKEEWDKFLKEMKDIPVAIKDAFTKKDE